MDALNEQIEALLLTKFEDEGFEDLFIVEINYNTTGNKLEIFLDSDTTLDIGHCSRINKYLQKHIDEHGWLGEKYFLDVSSPGVGKPLKLMRQYAKNINRRLEIWLTEGKPVTGKMTSVTDDHIIIEEEKGKKKKKEIIKHEISYNQIKRAIVKISF